MKASDDPRLQHPKGPTRKRGYEQKRKHKADVIRATRFQVFKRDRACRVCSRTESFPPHEMHELHPRSLMRGQPPQDVFTTANCVRLCRECHRDATEHRLTIEPVEPRLGANGFLRVHINRT